MFPKRVIFTLLAALCACSLSAQPDGLAVSVHNACIPTLPERDFNIIAEICIEHDGKSPLHLDGVSVTLGGPLPVEAVHSLRAVYSGTMSALRARTTSQALKNQYARIGGSQTVYCNPRYVMPQAEVTPTAAGEIWLPTDVTLKKGKSYLYISADVDLTAGAALSDTFTVEVTAVKIDGRDVKAGQEDAPVGHRLGVGVRQHMDDGVYAYRIPGLATTPSGTLIGVYDVRYHTSIDLQEDIDVGMSRSTDGGRTWEPMRIIMDMGEWGGLPQAQNGIGDPSVLVDEVTGEIFVMAVWTHGIGNGRAWTGIGQGMSPDETAQLMIVSSKDDGLTWSEPRNVTEQIKRPEWHLTLQGPGRGISMRDGTLVFPIQYIDADRIPNAGIVYSRDHGATWHMGVHAAANTTEAQVAEVEEGVLMLNMRNNAKKGRLVYTSRDLGHSWQEHPSSGALREPVCMASLLKVGAGENVLGRDILLFSNPDNTHKKRNHITVKASLDGGYTWLDENSLLLDEEECWGYSCLTMIDPETVGILYESSVAQMVFQAIKLHDIVKVADNGIGWKSLPEVDPSAEGYSDGVSAMYAGTAGKCIVVAGGANFPDTPASEGGKKVFYDSIYRYSEGVWSKCGTLPCPSAYGVTVSAGNRLIMAGGANADGAHNKVWAVTVKGDNAAIEPLPDLPANIEQAAGAWLDGKVYVAGGLADGRASDAVYALDLKRPEKGWTKCAEMPERSIQPAMAASRGALYLWCGFNPETKGVSDKGCRYDLRTKSWSELPQIPDGGTMVGGTALTLSDGRILCLGGVDRKVFENALSIKADKWKNYMTQPAAAFRFRRTAWLFNPKTGEWSDAGTSGRTARAGAALLRHNGGICLLGGEIKAGIRTPDTCFTKDLN